MSSIPVDEDPRKYSFHYLMSIECHSCCIYRELFGYSRERFAELIGKCSSLIRKLEVGELKDGHDEKEAYMVALRLGIFFVSDINNFALHYYDKHKYQLIGNTVALRIVEKNLKDDNPELYSLAKDMEKYAMRLAILYTISSYYKLDMPALEKSFIADNGSLTHREILNMRDRFMGSIKTCEIEPDSLDKGQLNRIWETVETYTNKLERKRRAFLALYREYSHQPKPFRRASSS